MGAVANQTDSAIAKFVDYDAALRSIGQQKGLVIRLEQQSQAPKAAGGTTDIQLARNQ